MVRATAHRDAFLLCPARAAAPASARQAQRDRVQYDGLLRDTATALQGIPNILYSRMGLIMPAKTSIILLDTNR